jgi:hypothetical protein
VPTRPYLAELERKHAQAASIAAAKALDLTALMVLMTMVLIKAP